MMIESNIGAFMKKSHLIYDIHLDGKITMGNVREIYPGIWITLEHLKLASIVYQNNDFVRFE